MIKEVYFSAEGLEGKSHQMLAELTAYRQRHKNQKIVPSKIALLVLDVQKYFLHKNSHAFVPSAPAILLGIQTLIFRFNKCELPVIFTKHIDVPDRASMMGQWWNDIITEASNQSQLADEIAAQAVNVIQKVTYDAFYLTRLDDILKAKGIKQLVITGLLTHLCCESTARSAFQHDYEVFFTIDGTATYNEDHHRATLLNLSHGFALPVLVQEVLDAIDR